MNLTPAHLIQDWAIFDNQVTVILQRLNPIEERFMEPANVIAIKIQTGESAGLTIADVEAGDSAQIDGQLTRWLLRTALVEKGSRITFGDDTFIVESSTKTAWEVFADCQCRDGTS